jgi:hypothetical protein
MMSLQLSELYAQLEAAEVSADFCKMRCADIITTERQQADSGHPTEPDVFKYLLQFNERHLIGDVAELHKLILVAYQNHFQALRERHADADKARQTQLNFDALIDVLSEHKASWSTFVKTMFEQQKSALDLLLAFRFITLKRGGNLLIELSRWNLEDTLNMQMFMDLLDLIRPRVRPVLSKWIGEQEQTENRYKIWNELNEMADLSFAEQMSKYVDELRYSIIQPLLDASKFQTWEVRDFAIYSAEWLRKSDARWKNMYFRRLADKVKAEIELSGLLISPEKVVQWFRTYEEKVKGVYAGDASWVKAAQARVQSYFLFEDSLNDLSLKRIKWVASQTEQDFADDDRASEISQKYAIVCKLNQVYGYLEDGNGAPNPEEIYKPKQDEELRKTVQQHIKNQVLSRKVELTKHRRIVALAFYNNGKYDVKSMFHFVNENKKNNREYLNFITWLYGDKTIIGALDTSAQRDLKSQIEWYLEMEVVPELDANSLKILLECEHNNIRKIAQGD